MVRRCGKLVSLARRWGHSPFPRLPVRSRVGTAVIARLAKQNCPSMSDSRTSSPQRSASRLTEWLHRQSEQQTRTPVRPGRAHLGEGDFLRALHRRGRIRRLIPSANSCHDIAMLHRITMLVAGAMVAPSIFFVFRPLQPSRIQPAHPTLAARGCAAHPETRCLVPG